jgi:hypothetical protein
MWPIFKSNIFYLGKKNDKIAVLNYEEVSRLCSLTNQPCRVVGDVKLFICVAIGKYSGPHTNG